MKRTELQRKTALRADPESTRALVQRGRRASIPVQQHQRECADCGESFRPRTDRLTTSRFCSRACATAYRNRENRTPYPPREDVERIYSESQSMAAVSTHYGHSDGWAKRVLAYYGIAEVRRSPITLTCDECGREFEVSPSEISRGRRYCSMHCRSARDRRKPESVRRLGAELRVARLGKGNPAYKHGKSEKGRAGRLRWHLRLKCEESCRNCGRPAANLHHIVPRSKSRAAREDVEGNGLPLCFECHRGWHDRVVTVHHDRLTDAEFARAVELGGVLWVERNYPDRGDVALMRLDEIVNRRVLRADRPETIDERIQRVAGEREAAL